MLKILRVHATSWIIKVLLGAIVIVFVFWGVGSWRSQRSMRVAVVNNEAISIEAYREAYNNILEQLRQQFGSGLNDDMIKMFQVEKQALEGLINQTLLLQEARKLEFNVSDDELAGMIQGIPAFQRAGVFDTQLYRRVLTRYRMTPETFEKSQRESLLIQKIRSFITGSAKVSAEEARQWYAWQKAMIDIDFVSFSPDSYEGIEPNDEELRAYYDTNKASYKTEPAVNAQYLRFEPSAFADRVAVDDEELREYYAANPNEFKTPKTVEARHILLTVDPDATAEDIEKKRKAAADIMAMAKEGKDFAALAKQYSQGPSKDSGGYLGVFEQKDMVPTFADKAFSMNAGEISEPVKTRFGWHVIKVEKVNPASSKSYEEAAPGIRKKMTERQAKNLAFEEAEAVVEATYESEDLSQVASARGLTLNTTDFFTKSGPVKGVQDAGGFASAAFELDSGEISDVKDLGNGFYIIQVLEKRPEEIPEYETVAPAVKKDLIRKKQEEKAHKDAEDFLASLKSGGDIQAVASASKVAVVSTGFFGRSESIPRIGFESEMSRIAFQLTSGKPLAEDVLKGKNGYYVIRLRERKAPDAEEFEREKDALTASLLKQKQTQTFNAWIGRLREKSEIAIEPDFFKE